MSILIRFTAPSTAPELQAWASPALFDGRNFWSYDTPQVIAQRTAYIQARGLAGAMVWSLDGDTASAELTAAVDAGLS